MEKERGWERGWGGSERQGGMCVYGGGTGEGLGEAALRL